MRFFFYYNACAWFTFKLAALFCFICVIHLESLRGSAIELFFLFGSNLVLFSFFFFLLFSMCLCRGLLVSVCVCVFSFSCAIYFIGLLIQGGGVFICPVCSRSLKSRPVLMKHMKLHDQNRKIYNCKLCSYTCNFGFNLKRHIATVHAKQAGIDSSPGNTNNNSSLAIMPTYNF